jgi:hypothetical protein
MILRTLAILAALSGPAFASIQCPTDLDGRHIARNDGALLYVGQPSWNQLLAPDKQARSWSDTNEWRSLPGQPLTLVCSYDGGRRAAVPIPAGAVHSCVQALATGAFVCR